ncbi:MAG: hypothetical protein SGPRY_008617, partial [Prymnesium sp.]
SSGYKTLNVVRDPAIPGGQKGCSALVDALLLAHSDFLLKSTSALAEFALWYNPALITEHLDLQISRQAAQTTAYLSLIPHWAGGSRRSLPMEAAQVEAMLTRLEGSVEGRAEWKREGGGEGRGEGGEDAGTSQQRAYVGSAAATKHLASRRTEGGEGVPAWPILAETSDSVRMVVISSGACSEHRNPRGTSMLRPATLRECDTYAHEVRSLESTLVPR